jgi:RNA polymerase-binding transcription factor DksA
MENKLEEGIYAKCSVCGQSIYEHMEENKKYYDEFEMCGSCVTGESAEYIDEL